MGILNDLNLIIGDQNMASSIFEDLFPSFMEIEYVLPNEYVHKYWTAYTLISKERIPNDQTRRKINGAIFEYILATLLIRERIFPIFLNAKVALVPNVNFDIILYSKEKGPICLSAKTSFRERYKQADLEATALKYVHRKSKSYLITLNENDAKKVNVKKQEGDIIGLDEAIYALGQRFNELISSLKDSLLIDSPTILLVQSNQIVYESSIREIFPNF